MQMCSEIFMTPTDQIAQQKTVSEGGFDWFSYTTASYQWKSQDFEIIIESYVEKDN